MFLVAELQSYLVLRRANVEARMCTRTGYFGAVTAMLRGTFTHYATAVQGECGSKGQSLCYLDLSKSSWGGACRVRASEGVRACLGPLCNKTPLSC